MNLKKPKKMKIITSLTFFNDMAIIIIKNKKLLFISVIRYYVLFYKFIIPFFIHSLFVFHKHMKEINEKINF